MRPASDASSSDTPGEITSASRSLRLACPGLGPAAAGVAQRLACREAADIGITDPETIDSVDHSPQRESGRLSVIGFTLPINCSCPKKSVIPRRVAVSRCFSA